MADVPTLVFADLPAATASPLEAAEIHDLLTLWGGPDAALWRDIEVIARDFMAVAHHEDGELRRRISSGFPSRKSTVH